MRWHERRGRAAATGVATAALVLLLGGHPAAQTPASPAAPHAPAARGDAGVAPVAGGAPGAVAATPAASLPAVARVGSVALTVDDLDRSLRFYTTVLPFVLERVVDDAGPALAALHDLDAPRPARVAHLRLGDERLDLIDFGGAPGRPAPEGARSNDRWFQHVAIVVRDMAAAHARIAQHVTAISAGPQRLPDWNPAAGGIEAFYFRDPDGHALELIAFPPGKGDPRWQRPSGPLFLGIDHTAIAVGDTDASVRFYRDRLGLRVAGGSENSGVEQERLSGVPGARVRITTLRAPAGPGIELLEYVEPRDGRPIPPDLRAVDLSHWQTALVAATPTAAAGPPSAPTIALPDTRLGFSEAVRLRDPDGHVVVMELR